MYSVTHGFSEDAGLVLLLFSTPSEWARCLWAASLLFSTCLLVLARNADSWISLTGADAKTLWVLWLPVSICFSPHPYRANGRFFSFVLLDDLCGLLTAFPAPLPNTAPCCCRASQLGNRSVSFVFTGCSGFSFTSFTGNAFSKRDKTRWKCFKIKPT